MTIYSGLYEQSFGNFQKPNITTWTSKAIERQQEYCNKTNQEYKLIKDIPWGQIYPLRESWTFGTLIKLVAIDDFIQSNESYFTWLDLDIYPTDKAFEYIIPEDNIFYAPFMSWSYCEQPGHEHMKCKRIWCGHKEDYYAVSSGMFRLNRNTAIDFWNYLNKDHSIYSDKWWRLFYERQISYSSSSPWMYGTDECFIEEWLNNKVKQGFRFTQLTDDIHSVSKEHDPLFLHYYGTNKENYGN
jgi:hypothetical protein